MTRRWALAGSLAFLLVAPVTVAGVVPWWITRWQVRPALLGLPASRALGAVIVAGGVAAVLESFARFALKGLGTPAPLLPTRRLVVSGLCRHVRNPMYVGVVAVILGQGLVLADVRVVGYAAALWVVFHLFVTGYEEPALRRTYGAGYDLYRESVPRWVPRVRPWRAQ